jgi:hypothetical protein
MKSMIVNKINITFLTLLKYDCKTKRVNTTIKIVKNKKESVWIISEVILYNYNIKLPANRIIRYSISI